MGLYKGAFRNITTDVGIANNKKREEWVIKTLSELKKGSKILDAGAGMQRYKVNCQHLDYVSQDFCQYTGEGDGTGLQNGIWDTAKIDLVSDIVSIPVDSSSFDAILCTEVFEHIPDPISAMKEFERLLKPGGILIITAPFCSLTHMAPFHFYSGFNKYFYEHHLPALGFAIAEITPNGNYPEYTGQELRRILEMYPHKPFLIKIAIALLLRFVGNHRRPEELNSDLLCYGYHVKAFKNKA